MLILRMGFLGSTKNIINFDCRYRGFINAINDSNFKEEDKILVEPTLDGAYKEMKEFLLDCRGDLPTALFALNDIMAF